jgi:syntaxin 1A
MVKDRLKELIAAQQDQDTMMGEVQEIQTTIAQIEANIAEVKIKHQILLCSVHPDDLVSQQLDGLTEQIKEKLDEVLGKLTRMGRGLDEEQVPTVASRIRRTQLAQLSKRFQEVVDSYHQTQLDYKERCKKNLQRQLMITGTGQNVDDERLEEMLEQGYSVFNEGIILQTQQAQASLRDIESRQDDLVKLEASITEMNQMFKDVAFLIANQEVMVDNIEQNVQTAAVDVDNGRIQIQEAKEHQRRARTKKIMIVICLAIFVLILISIFLGIFIK